MKEPLPKYRGLLLREIPQPALPETRLGQKIITNYHLAENWFPIRTAGNSIDKTYDTQVVFY